MTSGTYSICREGRIWRGDTLPASGSIDALGGPRVNRLQEVSKGARWLCDSSWIRCAVSLSMTTIGPPQFGQTHRAD